MRIEPGFGGVSVVLLGNFNPAIFTPAWFALHEILPRAAAENADLQTACPGWTAFSTEWLQLHVDSDSFQAATQQAPHIRVRDLVLRVFGELLPLTPIRALGINRDVHFRAPNAAARDRVCKLPTLVEPWGGCAKWPQLGGDQGGLSSLTPRRSRSEGRHPRGRINVTVGGSGLVGEDRAGIHVRVTDHFTIDCTAAESDGRAQLDEFLEHDFELSLRRAVAVVDHVMGLATDGSEATTGQSGRSAAGRRPDAHSEDTGDKAELARSETSEAVRQAMAKRHSESNPSLREKTSASTQHDPPRAPKSADTAPLASIPPPSPRLLMRPTLHALQEWEGYVVEIEEEEFVARLVELTAGREHETEEAVIPMEEISERDAARSVVGSFFRWVIGYERSADGTRKRVSRLAFRDLPRITKSDLRTGREWAVRMEAALKP